MERTERLETTLGELIVALTEEASKIVPDEKEACKVVAFALAHLLYNAGLSRTACQYWN